MDSLDHWTQDTLGDGRNPRASILIKFDLNHIASSLPRGKDIYNIIVISHIDDLATIIRSTNTPAIQSMKTGIEEFKKRISVGNFFSRRSSLWPHIHFFARLPQDHLETLTTFVTSALLAVSMIHSAPFPWTDYGFTLKNWRSALADTCLRMGSFIVAVTIMEMDTHPH